MLNTILYNTDISNYQSYFWIRYDVSVPRTRSELASHPTFTRSLYGKHLVLVLLLLLRCLTYDMALMVYRRWAKAQLWCYTQETEKG